MKSSYRLLAALALAAGLPLSASAQAYQDAVDALNPDHYWQLNETTVGTAVDSAGSENGTHAGNFNGPGQFYMSGFGEVGVAGPDNAPGLGAGNLAFASYDAASVGLSDGSNFANSTMTVAMWFQVGTGFPGGSDGGDRLWTNNQTDPNTSFQITLGAGANLVIGLNPALNGFPGAGLPSGSSVGNFQIADSEVVIKDDEWHHIVASRNGNNIEDVIVVIDGVNYGSSTWSDSTDTWGITGTNAQIGTRTPGDGGPSRHAMNGRVDEVSVWLGQQLTVSESIALYNAAIGVTEIDGDSDFDGDVDTVDITRVISNFTGAGDGSGPVLGRDIGNFDSDDDVDTVDITTTISNFTGAGGRVLNNGVPELIYDADTGEVFIDAEGQTIVSFSLQSEGRFQTNFDPTQLNQDVLDGALPSLNDNTENVIGWTSGGATAGFGYSGDTSDPALIGILLEAGLSQQEVEALLTQTSWAAPAGGDSGAFEVTVIPEPGSLALLGLGGLALLRRRR